MRTRLIPLKHGRRQSGFTMIEMLVAVLVVSIGLLGIAGMQAIGLQNNHGAYTRSQATFLAYDMIDRMRANELVARGGSYDIVYTDTAPSGTSVSETDLRQWLTNLAQTLPQGDGEISVSSTGQVIVKVRWLDDRVTQSTLEYVLESQI